MTVSNRIATELRGPKSFRLFGQEIEARPTSAFVAADPARVEQALANLVDNALAHGGGAIDLFAVERDSSISAGGFTVLQSLVNPRVIEPFALLAAGGARFNRTSTA